MEREYYDRRRVRNTNPEPDCNSEHTNSDSDGHTDDTNSDSNSHTNYANTDSDRDALRHGRDCGRRI
jgi:hypothetical protein